MGQLCKLLLLLLLFILQLCLLLLLLDGLQLLLGLLLLLLGLLLLLLLPRFMLQLPSFPLLQLLGLLQQQLLTPCLQRQLSFRSLHVTNPLERSDHVLGHPGPSSPPRRRCNGRHQRGRHQSRRNRHPCGGSSSSRSGIGDGTRRPCPVGCQDAGVVGRPLSCSLGGCIFARKPAEESEDVLERQPLAAQRLDALHAQRTIGHLLLLVLDRSC